MIDLLAAKFVYHIIFVRFLFTFGGMKKNLNKWVSLDVEASSLGVVVSRCKPSVPALRWPLSVAGWAGEGRGHPSSLGVRPDTE